MQFLQMSDVTLLGGQFNRRQTECGLSPLIWPDPWADTNTNHVELTGQDKPKY